MSQFITDAADYDAQSPVEIDFDKAVLLKGGGSICDIYKTRWHRRTVFIKRLKKEYRDSPLYLDALEKEFEVGVNLSYPSLPTYLAFSRDYIVMDFIDGLTLADMIGRGDPWLKDKQNRKRVLKQLIEAVEYLHSHNVVHCDIKADNIMITSNGHNLVLLDFDKCYTDYFTDTSGHPGRYDMSAANPGRVAMDWRGVANIAGHLESVSNVFGKKGKRRFMAACSEEEVNPEELKRLLDVNRGSSGKLYLLLTLLLLVTVALVYIFFTIGGNSDGRKDKPAENQLATLAPHAKDEVPDSAINMRETETKVPVGIDDNPANPDVRTLDAQGKADILEPLIEPYFSKLKTKLTHLATLKKETGMSKEQLVDSLRVFSDIEDEYISESFEILNETFPGVSTREAWRIMTHTKSYTSYKRWADPLQIELVTKD